MLEPGLNGSRLDCELPWTLFLLIFGIAEEGEELGDEWKGLIVAVSFLNLLFLQVLLLHIRSLLKFLSCGGPFPAGVEAFTGHRCCLRKESGLSSAVAVMAVVVKCCHQAQSLGSMVVRLGCYVLL